MRRDAAVFLFVCWNLVFLALRNPLDLGSEAWERWASRRWWWPGWNAADRATRRYATTCGLEQGWSMFSPPLWRSASFPLAGLEFDDGSADVVRSPNDLPPNSPYLRVGGWRQRKLEDEYIVNQARFDRYRRTNASDLLLWQAYVRYAVRRWRAAHPDDPRRVIAVRLLRRHIDFPQPDEPPTHFTEAEPELIGVFEPDGRPR